MKKSTFLATLLAATVAASALASNVSAMEAVGDVSVPYGTAVIDGNIDADEWKDAAVIPFNGDTAKAWAGAVPADFSTDVKALWDETGLYLAGEITDSTFMASTEGQYNGDAFQFSIDLGQVFYGTTESRAIFYSFGCWDGNTMVQRQESKNDAVVNNGDGVEIKTTKTSDGWSFELMLSWDMLAEDAELKSGKTVDVAEGTKLNMLICYLDKDTAGNVINAFGTTLTDEGTAFDWGPNDHGITLTLAAPVVVEDTPTEEGGATAPQTADAASIAIFAVAASAAALVVFRKKH